MLTVGIDVDEDIEDDGFKEPGICMDRPTFVQDDLDEPNDKKYAAGAKRVRRRTMVKTEANLVGSRVGNGIHLPLFDIDYSAKLLPSSTSGHYHLYLNRPVTWRAYKRVLKAMAKAGLIETGYYKASVRQGQAFLRVPWVLKRKIRQ